MAVKGLKDFVTCAFFVSLIRTSITT